MNSLKEKIDRALHAPLDDAMIGAFWTMIAFMCAHWVLLVIVYAMVAYSFASGRCGQ